MSQFISEGHAEFLREIDELRKRLAKAVDDGMPVSVVESLQNELARKERLSLGFYAVWTAGGSKMKDPIEPTQLTEVVILLDGKPLLFPADKIPSLFAAYIIGIRAEYYAGVDASRAETAEAGREEFDASFHSEVLHASRQREEVLEWIQNNMNVEDSPIEGIEIKYRRLGEQGGAR